MHCPECGKSNPAGSVYCNFCGKKLPTVDLGTTIKCPYCGEPGQEYRYTCSKCGKELPKDASGRPLQTEFGKPSKFCNNCGKGLGSAVTVCPYCGTPVMDLWSRSSTYGSEDMTIDYDSYSHEKTSGPTIAGVLLILAGLLAVGQGVIYLLADNMASSLPGYGQASGVLCLCGGLDVLFGLVAFGGAFSCFGRKAFWAAMIGAILGMLGLGFLLGGLFGLIALILVAISRNEFEE